MSTPRRRRAARGRGEDLREEIVDAAKALLVATNSADAVSIRAVAERVGVTAPSIYLHFADKDALLDAVVSDVFARLDEEILAAADAVPRDQPLERLRAQGMAYVRFALAHPEHYRLATMEPCTVPPDVDEVIRGGAFAHFTETVADCMQAGVFGGDDPLPIALDLWTAAHGVAALMIAKPYLPWGEAEMIADRVLRAAAFGHAVCDLIGGERGTAEFTEWLRTHGRSGAAG